MPASSRARVAISWRPRWNSLRRMRWSAMPHRAVLCRASLRHRRIAGSEERQARSARRWNETAARLSAGSVPASLVRSAGRAQPDAMAVIADGEPVSYAELNRRANRLATTCAREACAAGPARGDLHRARHRDGGRDAGDAQGGRRICAARSGISVGALAMICCATARPLLVLRDAARRMTRLVNALARLDAGCALIDLETDAARMAATSATTIRRRVGLDAAPPCLRDLHVGLDGGTEGA